jgi:hypothetical protein
MNDGVLNCSSMNSSFAVAAGLRCTLANNAYNARELRHQYIDSGAKAIFSSEDGVATSREMFKDLGLSAHEADKRIVVMSNCLAWAGGPSIPLSPGLSGLLQVSSLLTSGALKEEEKFDGNLAHETVYLCYSSGLCFLQLIVVKLCWNALVLQVQPGNRKELRYDVRNPHLLKTEQIWPVNAQKYYKCSRSSKARSP